MEHLQPTLHTQVSQFPVHICRLEKCHFILFIGSIMVEASLDASIDDSS